MLYANLKFIWLGIAAILLSGLLSHADERRLALLIGNESYPVEVGALSLPHEDVDSLGSALTTVGFDVTTEKDLDEDGMEDAISAFENRINATSAAGYEVVAFFYYSGHGASAVIDGERKNFFLPFF